MSPVYRTFIRYLRPYWLEEVFLLLLFIVSSISSLASPYFLKVIIDRVFVNKDKGLLITILVCLFFSYIIRILSQIASDYYFAKTSNKIVADIRKDLFSHLLRVRMDFFNKNKSGELVHKINNDVDKIQYVLTNSIIRFINNTFQITGIVILLCHLNLKLFLISSLVFPFLLLNSRHFAPIITLAFEKLGKKQAGLTNYFRERLQNIKLIKLSNSYDHEISSLERHLSGINSLANAAALRSSFNRNISTFLVAMGPIILFGWGGSLVLTKLMTLGSLVAFLQYLNRLYNPSLDLFYLYEDITKAKVSMKEVMTLLEQPQELIYKRTKPMTEVINGICFSNVSFSIGEKSILKNIDLVFEKGKSYAVVGSSGSGKTTIINLLSRLYQPCSGTISINHTPLDNYSMYDWIQRVAIVSQEAAIFHDTVRYNITYGSFDSTNQHVDQALSLTELDQLKEDADKSLDFIIGDNGGSLSGGQRQRIMLARAMLRVKDVLILDEATSALDSNSELKILRHLARMFPDKIMIVIAHRLSTVMEMDTIIVMEEGRVVEQGNHFQLINSNGAYYRLFQGQLNNFLENATS